MNKLLSKYLMYYPITIIRGELVNKYYKEYNSRQYASKDRIISLQNTYLDSLYRHAFCTSPFYKDQFKSLGLTYEDKLSLELPTINKLDIIDQYNSIRSSHHFLFKSLKTTGGSTGQAVTILKNSEALARERAATWIGYKWAGIEIGDKQARFWGIPLKNKRRLFYNLVDYISNRKRFSAFEINRKKLFTYYSQLKEFKPKYCYGYVSFIVEFSKFILQNDLPPINSIKCIITTSEILDTYSKDIIEMAFKVRVYNEYGCGEVGSIAHECESGNMHIMSQNLIIEIDSRTSNEGELIVTDLHNYAMPLIRYRLGDYGEISHESPWKSI